MCCSLVELGWSMYSHVQRGNEGKFLTVPYIHLSLLLRVFPYWYSFGYSYK